MPEVPAISPNKLCQSCRELLHKIGIGELRGLHCHTSTEQIRHSAEDGCHLCNIIIFDFNRKHVPVDFLPGFARSLLQFAKSYDSWFGEAPVTLRVYHKPSAEIITILFVETSNQDEDVHVNATSYVEMSKTSSGIWESSPRFRPLSTLTGSEECFNLASD
jgi:hypothetical protein